MKILLIDIESSPNIADVWGLWNNNVSLSQLRESTRIISWAAKWHGEDAMMFESIMTGSQRSMIRKAHRLLDQADVVVSYNGINFDTKHLNREFLIHALPPPSPFKQVDLLRTVRAKFRFPSNKLDYVAGALGIGTKLKHQGHELWQACMARDKDAWYTMEAYNKQDVVLLEKLYVRLTPWIHNNANRSVHSGTECCPSCGGFDFQKRGFSLTAAGKYQRYQCTDCATWFRAARNLATSVPKFRGV